MDKVAGGSRCEPVVRFDIIQYQIAFRLGCLQDGGEGPLISLEVSCRWAAKWSDCAPNMRR
jgi:hypothetical protein